LEDFCFLLKLFGSTCLAGGFLYHEEENNLAENEMLLDVLTQNDWEIPEKYDMTAFRGVKKSHTGIDISADSGVSIVAADSGTVTKAAVYSGYGNCVILDHGNGYVTLYGHLSA
jgi:murein DD-endopeptidase MepM/ murein hydrolase activator NlpD